MPIFTSTGQRVGAFIGAGALAAAVVFGVTSIDTGGSGGSGGSTTTTTSGPHACPASTLHVPGGPDGNGNCWPGPGNTGVPAGTALSTYTGPATITTAGTVIDGKTTGPLTIRAAGVIIRNTKVNGTVTLEGSSYSLTIDDSEVDGGSWQGIALSSENITAHRVDVHGAQDTLWCSNCTIEDSYIHGQYIDSTSEFHNDGIQMDGPGGHNTLRHNAWWCSPAINPVGGGCTSDISILPWNGAVTDVNIDRNLLVATQSGPYCTYGGGGAATYSADTARIKYTDNVFQKGTSGHCGIYGPWSDIAPGTVWTNNNYDDGSAVPAP